MQLGLIGYYSDFVVYPLVIAALAVAGLVEAGEENAPGWIATVLACLGLWTLTEYLLHRFVLHHIPYVKDLHDRHHGHDDGNDRQHGDDRHDGLGSARHDHDAQVRRGGEAA